MAAESNFSLLVIEDDEDIRNILVDVLTPLAKRVDSAEDGLKGLALLMENDYDCVVSDINMPNLTGLALLKEVRQVSMSVPFVFVTGFGDQKSICEALQLGATDFIDKPFEKAVIRESVRKSLEYGALLKEVDEKIDGLFAASNLPLAEVSKIKEQRRALWRMKALGAVYHKNGKVA